ncbi:serine hydrolase [Flavobacterium sp. MK4S-17]|uniref:serine hydrolase domain-containing protein n=1 Tax=Flavobacterium sp. MK4S-17 TaxID=2543737 RepID=UPI00135BA8AE|nr:serine hydrolase [Flavobacterium sp. MK4S-17]
MKCIKYLLFAVSFILFSCSNDDDSTEHPIVDVKAKLQQVMDKAAASGFPGLSLTVKSTNETYTLVSGKSALPSTAMAAGNLHYMQSISKTFTAAAVMKLKEEGKINLGDKINVYLPASVCDNLSNGNSITVLQLMNMTSGLPDFLEHPDFLNDVVSGELPMSSSQILSYVYGKPAHFTPGSKFEYCNVNYHLLALIIESITGNHHDYITKKIIQPAGLGSTVYLPGSGLQAAPANAVRSYLSDSGNYTDVTGLQFGTVMSFIGDDGIIATTQDVADFYVALLNKKQIVSQSSVDEMMSGIQFSGKQQYGLGLHLYKTSKGLQAVGHNGSGAGAAAEAYYFPEKEVTLVLATNVGTLLDEEKTIAFERLKVRLFDIALGAK